MEELARWLLWGVSWVFTSPWYSTMSLGKPGQHFSPSLRLCIYIQMCQILKTFPIFLFCFTEVISYSHSPCILIVIAIFKNRGKGRQFIYWLIRLYFSKVLLKVIFSQA